jgi:urease accessory protein
MTVLERTRGALRLRFGRRDGRTVATETFQSGALRVRFPNGTPVPEAVVINTAGGITGGDILGVALAAESGTRAVITSQACEKVYRALESDTRIDTEMDLGGDAEIDWLPQPAIIFDRARLDRRTQVHMAPGASLLALESCILGRTAMNEEVRSGKLADSWRVWRGGTLVYADSLRIDDFEASHASWALDAYRAYATLLYVAPDASERLDAMREILEETSGEAAASSWNGILLTRFLAPDGYVLISDLTHVLQRFRAAPMPRLWAI